jgi:hypothetical protein
MQKSDEDADGQAEGEPPGRECAEVVGPGHSTQDAATEQARAGTDDRTPDRRPAVPDRTQDVLDQPKPPRDNRNSVDREAAIDQLVDGSLCLAVALE